MDVYQTIETAAVAEFKDRGSKFIAHAFPLKDVGEFKMHLASLKKNHPKAVHHCFAYRLGNDGTIFRSSDDGEPSGTAGKPILGQIDSKNLTNILVVVVRYFGGTLLGVPGLINAYKTSASLVLQCTPIVQKTIEKNYWIEFNYPEQNEVLQIIKQFQCSVLKSEMQLFCRMEIGIPIKNLEPILSNLREIKNLTIEPIKS